MRKRSWILVLALAGVAAEELGDDVDKINRFDPRKIEADARRGGK